MGTLTEALALGLGSGPVCLAACGPVLLPWLGSAPRDLRTTTRLVLLFLGGRLAGYWGFAIVVWAAGLAIPLDLRTRTLIFGLANFGLAALLGFAACFPHRPCPAASGPSKPRLYQIGASERLHPPAAVSLGFFTGLNLCPPFVAAGVRAAATHTLLGALLFFSLFFAGTAVWFIPSLAVSPLRRFKVIPTIARMAMATLAVYYGYLGVVGTASWRMVPSAAAHLVISFSGMVSHV